MYTSFYGLKEQPFNITPDSRFLYLSQRHREALASLLFGIENRKGFVVITGEIGSGKTTLCRSLLKELDSEQIKIALIFNPLLTEVELLRAINQELGIESQYNSRKDLIDELNAFLLEEIAKGHNVVVVIDEAQNLTPALLEQIRLLSNLETETEKLLQIVLIGQPELQEILELPQLEQLNQRVSVRYHLEPLSRDEIQDYIRHRLHVAGAEINIVFTPKALDLLYEYSEGVPRKINVLCDRALLIGYVESTYEINESIVQRAIDEVTGKRRDSLPGSKSQGILTGMFSRKKRGKPEISPRFIYGAMAFMVLVVVMVTATLFYMNQRIHDSMQIYTRNPHDRQEPTPVATPVPDESTPLTSSTSKESSAVHEGEGETIAADVTTPVPTQPPKIYQYHWEYDPNEIIRVRNSAVAYQASILNWLRLWGYRPDLSTFKTMSDSEIMARDITAENSKLGLNKVDIYLPFADLINLDVPVILNLNAVESKFSPWVVLKRVQGYAVTLIDPVQGMVVTTQQALQSVYLGAVGIYFDRDNLTTIVPNEESARVKKVQEFLIQSGFLKGSASGIYDNTTTRAIEKMQGYYHLQQTGQIDPLTAMIISNRQQINRPRLFSTE